MSTMTSNSDSSQDRGRQSSNASRVSEDALLTENWRSKSDVQERRRIQNRLNQRAFRQRQRSGEPSRTYKKRSSPQKSSPSRSASDSERQDDVGARADSANMLTGIHPISRNSASQSSARVQAQTEYTSSMIAPSSDELAHLIRRNLYAAATANAELIGLDLDAMKDATWICTPRTSSQKSIPAALQPIEAQHLVPHDPFIDTIPHPRLRYNILQAISRQRLNAVAFSVSLRESGVLEDVNGIWQRSGLVVRGAPEQLSSWEVSEPFARRWDFLFAGCDDLIAATNRWRRERGETLFPPSLAAERHASP